MTETEKQFKEWADPMEMFYHLFLENRKLDYDNALKGLLKLTLIMHNELINYRITNRFFNEVVMHYIKVEEKTMEQWREENNIK